MNPTNVSLENTADLIKSSSGGEADSGASTVSELSIQLHNEQRLRQRLEERLKTLEQAAAAQAFGRQEEKRAHIHIRIKKVATVSKSVAGHLVGLGWLSHPRAQGMKQGGSGAD